MKPQTYLLRNSCAILNFGYEGSSFQFFGEGLLGGGKGPSPERDIFVPFSFWGTVPPATLMHRHLE